MEKKYLAISREVGERVFIGKDISVEIRRVKGHKRVTLVFCAPEGVRIEREERAHLAASADPDPDSVE